MTETYERLANIMSPTKTINKTAPPKLKSKTQLRMEERSRKRVADAEWDDTHGLFDKRLWHCECKSFEFCKREKPTCKHIRAKMKDLIANNCKDQMHGVWMMHSETDPDTRYKIRLYPDDESDSSKSDEEIVHVNECGEPIADEAFANA